MQCSCKTTASIGASKALRSALPHVINLKSIGIGVISCSMTVSPCLTRSSLPQPNKTWKERTNHRKLERVGLILRSGYIQYTYVSRGHDLYLLDGPHPTYSMKNKRGDLGKKADFTFSLNAASRTRRSGLNCLTPKLPG